MMQNIHFKAPNCWINDPNGFIWDNITCFINVFPMLRNGAECTGDTLSAKIW